MKWRPFLGAICVGWLAAMAHVGAADSGGENPPTFTKAKFAAPVDPEKVTEDWTARGYPAPRMRYYPQGWSRDEHTHPVSLIMTVVSGRMELTFAGQRFILGPGDELSYAANTVHSAKNLYDGPTQMMESER